MVTATQPDKYRLGVGIMLINSKNMVFIGQRHDTQVEAWQMPQGGLEEGETPLEVALRELYEETGVTADKVKVIFETEQWYQYEIPAQLAFELWGGEYIGQRQKWFLMRFEGEDEDIDISKFPSEFSQWKWANVASLQSVIVDFKRELYNKVIEELQLKFAFLR